MKTLIILTVILLSMSCTNFQESKLKNKNYFIEIVQDQDLRFNMQWRGINLMHTYLNSKEVRVSQYEGLTLVKQEVLNYSFSDSKYTIDNTSFDTEWKGDTLNLYSDNNLIYSLIPIK